MKCEEEVKKGALYRKKYGYAHMSYYFLKLCSQACINKYECGTVIKLEKYAYVVKNLHQILTRTR